MLEKLYVFGFFYLIYCLRYHLVWVKCFTRENNQYIDLHDIKDELINDKKIRYVYLLIAVSFYIFKAEMPSVYDLSLGFSIIVFGAIYSCFGRIHLNGSWANVGQVTKDYKPLVTTGVYSIIRNPIYIGLIIQLVGGVISVGIVHWPIEMIISALVYFFLTINYYHKKIIAEEKFLAKRHGYKFENYCLYAGRYLPKFLVRKPITRICTET